MSQEDTTNPVHPDARELAALLRPAWPAISAGLRASGTPVCDGETGAGEGQSEGDGEDEGGAQGGGQEPPQTFGREYVEKLRRENAAARTARQTLETKVKEFEDRDKSESDRAAERIKDLESKAQVAEQKVLRSEVAADKGVPPKLARFLTGTSKEELEKAADELLAELGGQDRTSFDGGARESAPAKGGMDDLIRRSAGR